MSDDLLDCLLSAAEEVAVCPKTLKEDPEFFSAITQPKPDKIKPNGALKQSSVVHTGDTDSSDDEHNKYFENEGYNEFGRAIKSMLPTPASPATPTQSSTWKARPTTKPVAPAKTAASDVFIDPLFGIRVVNPLVSHNMLVSRMQGRDAVPMSNIQRYVEMLTPQKDWVIAGVLVSKSNKTSQKGNAFSIWTLSDLQGELKTVSIFLFGSAYKELWKCIVGTVVGVLNPSVLDKKIGSKDEAVLSIDNVQRVMIFGQSKDLGTCKSTKKNGEKCTSFVNTHRCEFCIYHIRQEYQKCSKRSELQANFAGRGLTALRNKVLGKNEVFYAGKSFTAIPATRSKKHVARDQGRLNLLSGNVVPNNIPKAKTDLTKRKQAVRLEMSASQRAKDLEMLKRLGGGTDIESKTDFSNKLSSVVTLDESKNNVLNVLTKLKKKTDNDNSKENIVDSSVKSNKITNVEVDFLNEDNLSDLDYNLSDFEDDLKLTDEVSNCTQAKNARAESAKNVAGSKDNGIEATNIVKNGTKLNVDAKILADKKNTVGVSENNDQNLLSKKQSNDKVDVDGKKVVDKKQTSHKRETDLVDKKKTAKGELDVIDKKNTVTRREMDARKSVQKNTNIPNTPKTTQQSKTPPSFKSPPITLKTGFDIPLLSGLNNTSIDLSSPITKKHVDRAKMNALKWVQRNGPIKKLDPNKCKADKGKKRPLAIDSIIENDPKKKKIQESDHFSDRFKKMMAMSSKHTNLLEQHDNEEQDKYFSKLEMKERMEEKMIGTYKIECKAVRCITCKYTSFSAAERCKTERHPLKVFDAVKRFFKCGDCGNRTVSLDVIPTISCKNCGSGKWERTSMMKERQITGTHTLSIRGGEQKHTNSVSTNSNINLLVPDD